MTAIQIGHIIDNEEVMLNGGGINEIINPATGEVIAEASMAGPEDVARIVESAEAGYQSEAWQAMVPAERGGLLRKLALLMQDHFDEFVDLELRDTGKPITAVKNMDVPLGIGIVDFYAGAADKIESSVKNIEGGFVSMTMYEPYGVVAGFCPWNFPLFNTALKVACATAAGNSIIIKPASETPLTTLLFGRLCGEAGFPPGVVNVILCGGSVAGKHLTVHPTVKKLSLTGSTGVGKGMMRDAADQLKAVNLELGGKNAIVVFEDADLERAADAAIFSAFVNAGQLCVACSRLLVQESVKEKFMELVLGKMKNLKTGNPLDEGSHIGAMITPSQFNTVLDYLQVGQDEGADILTGGTKLELPPPNEKGLFITPTIFDNVTREMRIFREEIFGPVLTVTTFKDEAEAIEIANDCDFGLSGSVWTRDSARGIRMAKAIDTGIIWINNMLNGYPQICLAPHKESGLGIELGMEGIRAFSKIKSAVFDYNEGPEGWQL